MGKTSSNAGIHHYLKTDFQSDIKISEKKGIPLSTNIKPVETLVKTEYKDKNKKDLYFRDKVEFNGSTYEVDYDPKKFKWVLINEKSSFFLSENHKKAVLVWKCKARQNL